MNLVVAPIPYAHLTALHRVTMQRHPQHIVAESVAQFHQRLYPLSGFETEEAYLNRSCPMKVVNGTRVPLLVLNSEDDPICTVDNLRDNWHLFLQHPDSILVVTKRGGHCGFFQGLSGQSSWAVDVCCQFLTATADAKFYPPSHTHAHLCLVDGGDMW